MWSPTFGQFIYLALRWITAPIAISSSTVWSVDTPTCVRRSCIKLHICGDICTQHPSMSTRRICLGDRTRRHQHHCNWKLHVKHFKLININAHLPFDACMRLMFIGIATWHNFRGDSLPSLECNTILNLRCPFSLAACDLSNVCECAICLDLREQVFQCDSIYKRHAELFDDKSTHTFWSIFSMRRN